MFKMFVTFYPLAITTNVSTSFLFLFRIVYPATSRFTGTHPSVLSARPRVAHEIPRNQRRNETKRKGLTCQILLIFLLKFVEWFVLVKKCDSQDFVLPQIHTRDPRSWAILIQAWAWNRGSLGFSIIKIILVCQVRFLLAYTAVCVWRQTCVKRCVVGEDRKHFLLHMWAAKTRRPPNWVPWLTMALHYTGWYRRSLVYICGTYCTRCHRKESPQRRSCPSMNLVSAWLYFKWSLP